MAKQRPSKKGRTRKRANQAAKARQHTKHQKQMLLERFKSKQQGSPESDTTDG